ncbi:unnamed protein product [Leptidea sinapis]|uniref:ABC transmembrane type-1 domain-containing protein n=1 Tax=Leptidea sinapis TaxID=189913 RepID=A0A5E4Q579_9NEOP|nr:unnamed protein product [Leptidea sinapis]
MFAEECETAADLSTELGLGVGLFQAGTNFMVLATMFLGGHLMSTGQMSAGDVMAFLVNAQTIQRSVAQISLLFGSVVKVHQQRTSDGHFRHEDSQVPRIPR